MTTDAETTFAAVVAALRDEPGVDLRRAFAREVLTVERKIFAMRYGSSLVLKLPAERCAELGRPLERGGRAMREWVVTDAPPDAAAWTALAREAMAFVRPRAE